MLSLLISTAFQTDPDGSIWNLYYSANLITAYSSRKLQHVCILTRLFIRSFIYLFCSVEAEAIILNTFHLQVFPIGLSYLPQISCTQILLQSK